MSTVLLMTDSWQPTVLRLVPFSHNNARNEEKKGAGKGPKSSRGFPVLAVTRSGNTKPKHSSGSGNECLSSARALNNAEQDDASSVSASSAHYSEYTNFTSTTCADKIVEKVPKKESHKKFAKKKIPEMHSEMKEAIRFSVQDINDQVSSASSLNSSDAVADSKGKEKHVRVDNTRTRLPKPSLCVSPDIKHFSPINGVRRSVPLTPGELELQRHRDSYILEQAQKRKKYKLNVNQLPRSTTPINDHDPDKLNMKQVIAFLQTKKSKEGNQKHSTSKKSVSNTKPCKHLPSDHTERHSRNNPKETHQSLSRATSEHVRATSEHVDKHDNTRDTPGCISVLSTKSTPNLPFGRNSGKSLGTISVKSYGEKSSKKRQEKQRPMKEFKLYRFLAVAPDGQKSELATNVTTAVPKVETTQFIPKAKPQETSSPSSPKRFLRRRSRDSTTANLLHRRAVNRNGSTPPMMDTKDTEEPPARSIRLPSMDAGEDETPGEDSDTASTTSATCNSTKHGSSPKDDANRPKSKKKSKTISFSDEKQEESMGMVEKVPETPPQEDTFEADDNNNSVQFFSGFPTRTFKTHEFPKVNIHGPRHIHINMPQENQRNSYSQEIVRLTLRQEKNSTRVTSYMSDIQSNSPSKYYESKFLANDDLTGKHSPFNHSRNRPDSRERSDSPRNFANTFIKVRQKLKSTNLYNGDSG